MSESPPSFPRPAHVAPFVVSRLADRVRALSDIPTDLAVTGVAQAHTKVHPGDLYVARPGARFHGAEFANDAARAGAAAVVTDEAGAELAASSGLPILVTPDPRAAAGSLAALVYGNPSTRIPVIGITGTNGKTTVAYMLSAALEAAGHTVALMGTVQTRIGSQTWPAERTTPEADELQALCAYAVEQGVTAMVIEASSHGLALGRLHGMRFTAGVFTHLTAEHLDLHGSMEEYFAAKAILFSDSQIRRIVMIDDEYGKRVANFAFPGDPAKPAVTVSLRDDRATWHVADLRVDGMVQRFALFNTNGDKYDASIVFPGAFNVANAALAIATASVFDVPPEVAASGVASMKGIPGRMERVAAPSADERGISAVVDYAHAPDGVVKALEALRPSTAGRLICVLGCGGDRDTSKRASMGAAAARLADIFIATDDNPRSEDPSSIRHAMLAGAYGVSEDVRAEISEVPDRREAIEAAVRMACRGDTVAVLGKGHEQGQEIDGTVFPFDDRAVLEHALGGDVA